MTVSEKIKVQRSDIDISEIEHEETGFSSAYEPPLKGGFWAHFSGYLSTGEWVSLQSKRGDTVPEALEAIEKHIEAQGWEIV